MQVNDDAEANDILTAQASTIDGTPLVSGDDSSGVTITQDDSSTLEFSGTLEQINNAFNGFTFTPNLDYTGEQRELLLTIKAQVVLGSRADHLRS